MIQKVVAIVLVVLLVANMFYYGMGGFGLFVFWFNVLVIGLISFMMYGDKSKLKRMLNRE